MKGVPKAVGKGGLSREKREGGGMTITKGHWIRNLAYLVLLVGLLSLF